jgi:shikimate dehydrogenase
LNGGNNILANLLDEIQAAGYSGVNITHPCKQTVIQYLDSLSDEAADVGAVNTVIFGEGKRTGHNTDWLGFYLSFKGSFANVPKDTVLQLGAGGAGSAVAYAMTKAGVKSLHIYDLEKEKARTVINRLHTNFPEVTFSIPDVCEDLMRNVDGIINTTPVGMKKYPGTPLPGDLLTPRHWVADVIYFPIETELLKMSRELGCRTMDGSGMAINQAAEAFRLFTGKGANIDRLAQTFFWDL